jgi:hypothetical protein
LTRSSWGLDTDRANWRDHAACSLDTAHLFELGPRRPRSPVLLTADNRQALEICAGCPVRAQCLEDALDEADAWPRIAGGQVVVEGKAGIVEAFSAGESVVGRVHAARHDRRWMA